MGIHRVRRLIGFHRLRISELIVDFRTPSDVFSSDVFFGGPEVWQILNFSWKASADPHLGNSIFYCAGDAPNGYGSLNVTRYCNPEVESLVRSTDSILDPDERASTYNDADRLYLADVAVVPLYQKRDVLAWSRGLSGPTANMSRATFMWNLPAWDGPDSIVIALETAPTELDPVGPWNEDTAVIMRSLVSGAYTTTPDLQFVPVLIESAETWTRDG